MNLAGFSRIIRTRYCNLIRNVLYYDHPNSETLLNEAVLPTIFSGKVILFELTCFAMKSNKHACPHSDAILTWEDKATKTENILLIFTCIFSPEIPSIKKNRMYKDYVHYNKIIPLD